MKCFASNFRSALWGRPSPVVMNRAERFSHPPHQQIAIGLRRGLSHKLYADCTFGKLMARLSPWLTDSDGGGERWRATDGGGGLSRASHLCLRDGALSSLPFIIHQSSAPPLGPLPSAAALFPYAGPGRARLHLIRWEGGGGGGSGKRKGGYIFFSLPSSLFQKVIHGLTLSSGETDEMLFKKKMEMNLALWREMPALWDFAVLSWEERSVWACWWVGGGDDGEFKKKKKGTMWRWPRDSAKKGNSHWIIWHSRCEKAEKKILEGKKKFGNDSRDYSLFY